MKKFFDCGTHMFQGFKEFSKMYGIDESWKSYCFEANPITYDGSKKEYLDLLNTGLKIEHFNFAVSDRYEEFKINCAMSPEMDGYTNQGSNILNDPPKTDKVYGGNFSYERMERSVRSVDFSDFINKNSEDNDFVLVKMDIEGSEFQVIDGLINSGSFKKINEIYVEFHERFFENEEYYRVKKNNFAQMFAYYGIKFNDWK